MKVYNYNPLNGEYLGFDVANKSPREHGVYLIPANATTIIPLEAKINNAVCWNGNNWEYRADYREKTYFDKITKEIKNIKELGIIPDPNWTDIEPIDPESEWNGSEWIIPFNILKKRKKDEIALARYQEVISGIVVDSLLIKTDYDSQSSFYGMAINAILDSSYVCNFKSNNGFILLNSEMILKITNEIRKHIQIAFDKEAELVILIDKATTIDQLNLINYV